MPCLPTLSHTVIHLAPPLCSLFSESFWFAPRRPAFFSSPRARPMTQSTERTRFNLASFLPCVRQSTLSSLRGTLPRRVCRLHGKGLLRRQGGWVFCSFSRPFGGASWNKRCRCDLALHPNTSRTHVFFVPWARAKEAFLQPKGKKGLEGTQTQRLNAALLAAHRPRHKAPQVSENQKKKRKRRRDQRLNFANGETLLLWLGRKIGKGVCLR